jgi:hypothetical protein
MIAEKVVSYTVSLMTILFKKIMTFLSEIIIIYKAFG